MSQNKNFIQYGDIIQINQKIFFVNYISSTKLELINEDDPDKTVYNIVDGVITDGEIDSIEILSREDNPSYAVQNNLNVGVWVTIEFGGSIPLLITGEITSVEEDMIEISQVDEDDKLYIDFGYKGLPPDLMIQKITIRDNPTIEVKDDVQTHELDTSVSEALKEGDSVKLDIKLDSMIEIVDVPEEEYRYLIEEQTNDLFENLLSKIGTQRRTNEVMRENQKMINRYVELREQYSKFENHSVVGWKDVNEKPIISHVNDMDEMLKWIIPITKYIKKMYDLDKVDEEILDVKILTTEEQLSKEDAYNMSYEMNTIQSDNIFNAYNKQISEFYKPYEFLKLTENVTTVKSKSKLMLIDNLGNYTSSVISNNELNNKQYVMQNILQDERVSVMGYMILPENVQRYFSMYLPSTNIMKKVDLSQARFFYEKYLSAQEYYPRYKINENNIIKGNCNILKGVNVIESMDAFLDTDKLVDCIDIYNINSLNIYDIIQYLYLYKIDIDSIKWNTGERLLNMVKKSVMEYKKKVVDMQKKIRPYKIQPPEMGNIKPIFPEEEYNDLLTQYGILKSNDTMPYYSDSELIYKMNVDMGTYLYNFASEQNASLRTSINFDTLSKYVDADYDFHKMSCELPNITKKYTLQSELENDNGKDIYVDKEYDDTDYSLRSEFSAEQSKMSEKEFKTFLKKVILERKIGGEDEVSVRQYIENILKGRKLIMDGDYAVSKIFEENQLVTKYYIRKNNTWMEDENIDILCNLNKTCIQSENECKSYYEKNAINQKQVAKEIMSEASKIKTFEKKETTQHLSDTLNNLNFLNQYKIRKYLHYNNNKILIAKLLDDTTILESPFEDMKNKILSDSNLISYYENIQLFVTNYTRSAINDENQNWLYCADTGLKLLPKFIYTLSNAFLTYNNYNETLQLICDEIGTLSDDGNSIVDKNSGYVIKKIELEYVDEYTEGGFKSVYHDVIDEEYEYKVEKTRKEADINKKIKNIVLSVSGYMGISLKDEMDFIVKHTIEILDKSIGTKDDYIISVGKSKADNYEIMYNKSLISITLGLMVIAIQVSTPSLKTSKTFPGCVKSLEGAPVYGDSPGCIQYISCIASKIKTQYDPWNSIRKMNEIKLSNSIKTFMDKFMLNDLEIMRRIKDKQHYLLNEGLDDLEIPSIQTWSDFVPLLYKLKIKSYESLPDSFHRQLDKYIKQGDMKQVQSINSLYGKLYHSNLSIQNEIQSVINKEDLLLKNSLEEPFLENACCTSNDYLAMLYFFKKNSQIQTVIERSNGLILKLNAIKGLERPMSFTNNEDTRVPILYPAIEFSEEIIYRAFIRLCNIDNNLPIPEELTSFIDKKPSDEYNPSEEIFDIKIERLKSEGHNFNQEDLLNALKILGKKNIYKNKMVTQVNKKERFIELINILAEHDKTSVLDYELIENMSNIIDNQEKGELKNALIKCNDDLKDLHVSIQTKILKTVLDSGLITKNEMDKLKSFIENYSMFDNQLLSNEVSIMYNQITTLLRHIPMWLMNNVDITSFKIPVYWGLSENHKMDIIANPRLDKGDKVGFVAKYYEHFSKYLDNEIIVQHLQSILDKLSHVYTFLGYIPNYSTHSTSENLKLNPITIQYLYHYLFLKIIDIYMSNTDNLEIIRFVIDLITMFMNDKSVLNKNYESVMKNVLRDRETEKDKKTTYLKDLTSDERSVDNILKKHKIGKWGIGLEKGLFSYDKDFYDAERTEQMLDDFFKENTMDNLIEENDLSLFANDDDFGENMDGDERF